MKPQSCKGKGRSGQQEVRDVLRNLVAPYGLVDEDIESRGMGQNGEDIILSPAAQVHLPWKTEIKREERLNVITTFWDHFKKYLKYPKHLKLLIHRKNHTEWLITMRFSDFIEIFRKTLPERE